MPESLSLAEVNERVQHATLPELERYLINLLPGRPGVESAVLAQALWNTRGLSDFRPEFDAQWKSLTERLKAAYDVVDDLETKAADREDKISNLRRSNMMREGTVKIKVLKDETDAIREQDDELERRKRLMEENGPAANAPLVHPPSMPPRKIPPMVSDEDRAAADALEEEGLATAAEGAQAGIRAGQVAGAGLKMAGKGAWSGLKLGGRGLKAAGSKAGDALNTPVSGENLVLWMFLFLTLGLHAVLVSFGMQLQWFLYVGGAILLGLLWWAFRGFAADELKFGLIASLVAGVPYLLASLSYAYLSNPDYINSVVILAIIVPVWPVLMIAKLANRNKFAYGVFWVYRVALVILMLVFVVWPILGSTLGALPPIGDRVDVGGATVGFWDLLTERWDRVTNRVATLSQLYTNPDYYTGRVDENKGKPLGVTISDLRPVDPEIANDSQMVLFANVETRSFIGEQVQIIPACVIDRADAPPASNVEPNVLEIVYGTTGSFECAFEPPVGGWRRGVYGVRASATFPFQTWGYLPYTFVDEELARNLARQGLEVRRELDIDQDPDAVYTSGPVVLGMGGTDQPILVRREDAANNWLAPGSRVGATLDGGWQDGKITSVKEIQLKVPEDFVLTGCDRDVTSTETDPNAPGYVSYVFENPADTSVAIDYTTITCKLGLASAEDAAKLVQAGDKTERTFVAVAIYDYTTEERESVRVR